ncbi:MAG TPA: hypothetical protein VER79_12690, partial [Candidatus Limnocylindrales bacterium]|nr:hypothetical protein [Candidatus Limnocylindrales bacterium]
VGAFGKGWDDFETMTDEFVQVAQEKTNGQRLVIVSNQKDFFEDFEASYGGDIPSAALSFGNDWDLYCAALAEVSAQIKRAVEALRGAEALASVAVWLDPRFMDGREAARDQAWMDLGLFWEHNFGVAGRDDFMDERIAWQRQLADEVTAYVTMLRRDALALITSRIAVPYGEHRFIAFNPLGCARTDIVDVPFDQAEPAHVIDVTTGDEVPSQTVVNEGRTYLRVLASEVPAVGYKTFEVRSGAGERGGAAIGSSDGTLETSRYRVTVSGSGAIISLIDKVAGGRELIQLIGGRAANDLGGSDGVVVVENAGPVSATLLAQGDGPLAHRTRIVLIEGVDRIEVVNEITENFNDVRTWAFSFNLPDASLWHEEVGALLRVKLEQEGGHYSAQNARYDWLTLNHFADLSGADGYGATLSNADCYFMKFGGSTPEHLDTSSPQINVLAGGRVGGDGRFGIPDQGGDRYFLQRFALRGRAEYSPASAMRFALEHQNPLIARMLPGASTSEAPVETMPEDQFSLLHLDSDEVLLWALKPSDDQPGALVVRAWNLADSAQPLALATASAMPDRITPLTHIETPSGDVVAFADEAEQLML